MAKDAKGHGSDARGGGGLSDAALSALKPAVPTQPGSPFNRTRLSLVEPAAHQTGVDAASKGLFSDSQIAVLKEGYAKIKSVDPIQPSYGRLTALLDRSSPAHVRGADAGCCRPWCPRGP